jgi:hypothetical protein
MTGGAAQSGGTTSGLRSAPDPTYEQAATADALIEDPTMDEKTLSREFTNLVGQVVEAVRVGTLLNEELFQQVLQQIPAHGDEKSRETIALAVRQLGSFCDWPQFGLSKDFLQAGGCLDDVSLEIQRISNERTVLDREAVEEFFAPLALDFNEMLKDQRHFMQTMRDAETLGGFDQEVANELFSILGAWDQLAVPA